METMEVTNISSLKERTRDTASRRLKPACVIKLLALLAASLPFVAQAQFYYTTTNGKITITGYTGSGSVLAIPYSINDMPVTGIGESAFSSLASLTSVTIPSSVTRIGRYAFSFCTSLRDITIPGSVTTIEEATFLGCRSLTSVVLPASATRIEDYAFSICTNLTHVTIPSGVNSIGQQAFTGCSSLTNVTIERGVTNIGEAVFYLCSNLPNVTIPDSVTSLGHGVFQACRSLTNLVIPNSVTTIGDYVFVGCTSLTAISVDANNSNFSSVDGVLFNKNRTTLIQYPGGRAGKYIIPSGVETIGDWAFAGSASLTDISIPSGVTSIGLSAFARCSALTSVLIPNCVTNIREGVFNDCLNLDEVYFQGNAPRGGISIGLTPIIYYLPGTTGWGPTFGGRPTTLWSLPNPLILNHSLSLGVPTNKFGFVISWAMNRPVVVEACEDLTNPVWTPAGTNTLTEGSSYFSDPHWTNSPARFYRLREQ